MGTSIRLLKISFMAVLVSGCATPMIALKDVNEIHVIDKPLTKEQVRESIMEGATYADWSVQDLDSDTMLATYQIRSHTIHVQIAYTASSYGFDYKSSNDMKIYCTKTDSDNKQEKVLSGVQTCPGDIPPYAIHEAYQTWVDDLNHDIQTSLASK